ncbi:MAG: TolC family protein [Pseudomonadota bacterium]
MIRRSIPILSILLLVSAGAAEERGPLTLQAAIERAQGVAPKIRRLRALESAAHASSSVARGGRWPSVNASAGYARYSDVPSLTANFGNGPVALFPNLPNNYRTRVEGSVPLFTGGKLSSAIAAARNQESSAEQERESSTADLTLETTVAYWGLVTAAESETVLSAAVASYDGHLKDAENRARIGMAARNDVLAVSVERDQAELSLIQARDETAIARANLLRLLDYGTSDAVEPSDRLDPVPAHTPPLEESIRKALESRADRKAAASRLAAANETTGIARSVWWPQISAVAGYDYARPNRRIVPNTDEFKGSWDAGINLTLNLFEGGRTRAGIDQAEAQAEATRAQLAELDQRIRFEVSARLSDLQSANAAIPVALRNVESATENLKVSQNRYRAGVIPSSELLDAETALLRAGLLKVDVLARIRVTQAQFERTIGE